MLSVWWPRPKSPHHLWVIPHPNGTHEICKFPRISKHSHVFEAAPVFLLFGQQFSKSHGYGYTHILEGHWKEIGLKTKNPSPESVSMIARFVSEICTKKSLITCEFESMKGNHKPIIVRATKGTAVLQHKTCNVTRESYYSVVTAMVATKAKGSVIGAL